MRINPREEYFIVMAIILLLAGVIVLQGCSTVVTRYEYPEGKAEPVERIRIRGVGKAKVDGQKYEIESKSWVEIPSLPDIELHD